MTNSYKNKTSRAIGTTTVDLYTVPASTTTIVQSLCLANIVSETVFVSVKLFDATDSSVTYIVKDVPILSGSSFTPIGSDSQSLILETGDKLQVVSDVAASLDGTANILEMV